ncbi:MAG TPA: hypothetical protein VHE78_12710, partial [Gemmatimonadaceae bacterium]|nr:hypothetical protein [Gemmatimonadaceae bacterium]
MLAPWVAEARRALGGQSFPLLTAIICNTTGYLPDFLVPPPSESSPRFDDELAAVLSADDDVMVREIARTSRSGVLRADLAERLEEPARLRSGLA